MALAIAFALIPIVGLIGYWAGHSVGYAAGHDMAENPGEPTGPRLVTSQRHFNPSVYRQNIGKA